MATEVIVSIIPAGGGDYTSLSSFESGEQRDLVSADEIAVGECHSGSSSDGVTFAGWTTSSTQYIDVRAADGHHHQGDIAGGFGISRDAAAATVSISQTSTKVRGIRISQLGSGSAVLLNAVGVIISECMVYSDTTNGVGISIGAANPSYVINNIVFDHGSTGINGANAGVTCHIYNNTVVGCPTGINRFNGSLRPKNNIVQDASTACFAGTFDDAEANISDDTTSPNVALQEITIDFVDAANDDYHLAETDTDAIGAGVDLSADANFAFDYDIDGDTRPTSDWDIGADQTIAAAATGGYVSLLLLGVGT